MNDNNNMKHPENINQEVKISRHERDPKLFSRENVKSYLIALSILFGIIGIYYLETILVGINLEGTFSGGVSQAPPTGRPPIGGNPPSDMNGINIWPFWGTFSLPTLFGIFICISVFVGFLLIMKYYYNNESKSPNIYLMVLFAILLIIGTNLINGWVNGVEGTIVSYVWKDAIEMKDVFSFISNYENIQEDLTSHARTHPPGSVILINLLFLLFKSPGIIAIAMCVIASLLSAYFLNGIFKRYFDEEMPKYMTFLFLLLPAIQVYYLANTYAIVAALIFGVLYFYFHPNQIKCIIGSIVCLFLATFITFMAFYIALCLFLFVFFTTRSQGLLKRNKMFTKNGIFDIIKNFKILLIILIGIIAIYCSLLLFMDFNYINAFFNATSYENPDGTLTLFSDPLKYINTRIKDIMDILMFFGPVLIVLCYRGFKILKKESSRDERSSQIFLLTNAALLALLIIFLTGAYDHGETARAAMYIYPFLLLPVAVYLKTENFSRTERNKLLFVIFIQVMIMQLFGYYIW